MSDKPLTYEEIERAIKTEPERVLSQLPDNIERRRAEDHIKIAVDYAYRSREKRADR